jgi:hypothetical protein
MFVTVGAVVPGDALPTGFVVATFKPKTVAVVLLKSIPTNGVKRVLGVPPLTVRISAAPFVPTVI